MRDTVRRLGDMSKGPAKRVREVASTITTALPAEQLRDAATGIVRAGRDSQIVQVVRSEIERRLRSLGLAGKDELDRLKRRVAALEEQRGSTKRRSPAAGRAPQKTAARKKPAGKKPARKAGPKASAAKKKRARASAARKAPARSRARRR